MQADLYRRCVLETVADRHLVADDRLDEALRFFHILRRVNRAGENGHAVERGHIDRFARHRGAQHGAHLVEVVADPDVGRIDDRARLVGGVERGFARALAEDIEQAWARSEEHTSELQSLMRISDAVFSLLNKMSIYA